MKMIRPAILGQGRVNVVGHRTWDRAGLMTAKTREDYLAVGDLPGTPAAGPHYTEKSGSLVPGEAAARYEAGDATSPDYYSDYGSMSGSRQFTTRRH
jgi:hypothetical protein